MNRPVHRAGFPPISGAPRALSDRNEFQYSINQRLMDKAVVLVAIGLPPFLATAAFFGSCMRNSVSHFYYEPVYGDIFVGAMFFIGIFLLVYQGQAKLENRLARLAALGAFGTALFPVKGSGCEAEHYATQLFAIISTEGVVLQLIPHIGSDSSGFFRLSKHSHLVHTISAAFMSGFLAYYAIGVLGKTRVGIDTDSWGRLLPVKKRENSFYRFCGYSIIFAIVVMAGHVLCTDLFGQGIPYWDDVNGSFIAETVAIEAFGISWLISKGLLRSKDEKYPSAQGNTDMWSDFAMLEDIDHNAKALVDAQPELPLICPQRSYSLASSTRTDTI